MGTQEFIIIVIGVFILALFSSIIFLTWFFINRAKLKNQELLIEKGVDIKDLVIKDKNGSPWLKFGIVVLGLSIGLLIIGIIPNISNRFAFPILGISGGISLIIASLVNQKVK